MTTVPRYELSLICHPEGVIQRVFASDLGAYVPVGESLNRLLLPESWVRCQRFLRMAVRRGASIGCELTVLGAGGPLALQFVGVRLAPDAVLVVAAPSAEAVLALLRAYFDPERATAVRDGLVHQRVLDELARVNSELVNTQRELAKDQAVMSAQSRHRGDLLATVAHDLRTPMTVVLGYCELLGRLGDDAPDQTGTMVQRVCEAAQYALSLLSQTLEYAKLESGALTLRLEQTDLCELVEGVIDMHRSLATAKNIQIALVARRDAVPLIRVDRMLTQQVVGNLLSNAIKYSPRDTRVEVHVERGDGHLALGVQDQGLGIEPSFLPRLFHPFQTTSTRGTAGEKSTGLGLAIVHKLVAAHGGTVEVTSVPHEGSTFVVKLPLRTSEASGGVMVLRERETTRQDGAEGAP